MKPRTSSTTYIKGILLTIYSRSGVFLYVNEGRDDTTAETQTVLSDRAGDSDTIPTSLLKP